MSIVVLIFLFVCGAKLYGERVSQDFQARLLTPVASYSRTGAPFNLKILGPVLPPQGWTLPAGTVIRGFVRRAKSLGLGLKSERSILELGFHSCELPTGEGVDCAAKLVSVDNARESVKKDNRIEGILAAANPHSWLNGIWYRPSSAFLRRSSMGLTGASGALQNNLFPTPAGAALMIGLRFALIRLPDPEIHLPAGTDLILRVSTGDVPNGLLAIPAALDSRFSEEFLEWLRGAPSELEQPDRTPAVDLMNVALLGTKEQLIEGFAASGWLQADQFSVKSFTRTYAAAAAMHTYPTAPFSALYYQGRLPDLVFQKSFNSLAKRHHVRFWRVESPDGPVWLGAATHDTGLTFRWKSMTISHRIDSRIDRERSVVVNDLLEAGCVESSTVLARPGVSNDPGEAVTDGSIAVGTIEECEAKVHNFPVLERPRRTVASLLARRLILETRHYFTRGNTYYWAYRGVRQLSSRGKRSVTDTRSDESGVE